MKVAHTNSKVDSLVLGDYDQTAPLGTHGLTLAVIAER